MSGPDEWLSPARAQKPAYSPANIFHQMLETERLILRNWQAADLEPFAAINADPRVMEFFPACLSRAESDQLAGRISARLNQRGWGLYAVESKNTAAFLGFTGLSVPAFEAAFTPCVEIGWRIAHAAWGQGIATEAATAVVQFAFSRLNLPELVSFTTAANVRSRRVMEKVGMAHRAEDDFDHPAIPQGHPLRRHVLYRLGNSLHFAALNPTVASQRLLNPSPGRQG